MALLNWDIKLTEVILLSLTQKNKQILTHFFQKSENKNNQTQTERKKLKNGMFMSKKKNFPQFQKDIWFLWSEHSPVEDEIRKMIRDLCFEKKNERKRQHCCQIRGEPGAEKNAAPTRKQGIPINHLYPCLQSIHRLHTALPCLFYLFVCFFNTMLCLVKYIVFQKKEQTRM